jgi:membrane protein required for colicin V production
LLTGWDWLVLIALFVSTALGLWRGAVRTLFGLAAWILGVLVAPFAGGWLVGRFGPDPVAPMWVFYIAGFLVVFLSIRFGGFLILKGVRSIGLAGVDRMFGAALGVARAGLVVLVVAVVAHRLGLQQEAAWKEAQTRPLLDWMVEAAEPWLPQARPQPARSRAATRVPPAVPVRASSILPRTLPLLVKGH